MESRSAQGEGNKVERDDFGRLLFIDKFENGEKVLRTTYYPNEAPKEIIPYVDGKVCGLKKTFLPAGEPVTIEEWSENYQDGITTVFQNGEKIAEVPYVKGVKNGIEERYRDGQFVAEEIPWKNGRKHGPCYCYIGEGSHVSWFYEGNEVTKAQYDRVTRPSMR
ncbi:MAG: toxin-antitoxin system YwqK family antitoxin [Waddliaceae bacterium]